MNTELFQPQVQQFLKDHLNDDISQIVLQGSPFPDIGIQKLAQQLLGLQKTHDKLPLWHHTTGILFPPKIHLEQCSSEITATYKAGLITGESLIDITGGFGVDAYYFSKVVKDVWHCEMNTALSNLVAHNTKTLSIDNINFIEGDSITHLTTKGKKYTWIYADPSRRDSLGGRVFKLSDCLPNIPKHLEMLLDKCQYMLLKTSPLLDISKGLQELRGVFEIHVLAVNNDVKELLWLLNAKTNVTNVLIKTVNFTNGTPQVFQGKLTTETFITSEFSQPLGYLYEPNSAVMKSGLFKTVADKLDVYKLHQHSHLYTSSQLIEFPGRSFKIKEVISFNKKLLKARFKGSSANITTRNFKITVTQLRQILRIGDGGTTYMFFTTNLNDEPIVLICEKC